jgi:TPR repeat protein
MMIKEAVAFGLPIAQHALGCIYELGIGRVNRNLYIAKLWLGRAEMGGYRADK